MYTWSGCGQRDASGVCWSHGALLGLRVNSESPGAPLASMRVLLTGPRAWHCQASNIEGVLPQHHRLSPDAGRDWGQEEKGMTEDEMAGWHHRLDGHEFE